MKSVDLGFYLPWTYSVLLNVRRLEKTLWAVNLYPSPLQANNPPLMSHLYRVLSGKYFGARKELKWLMHSVIMGHGRKVKSSQEIRTKDLCSRVLLVSGWLRFVGLVYLINLKWQFDPSKQEAWRQAQCWLLSCALHVCIWRVLGMFPAMLIICSSGAGPRTCRFGLWGYTVVTVLLLKACIDKHICFCMQVRVAYSARKADL